ncbi:MAG: hypothetical protein ACJ71Q_19320 [Terriglobales bacterium]
MSTALRPGKCPICGGEPLRQLPVGYKMFVEKFHQKEPIGGLLAYQCVEKGHVFFVRASDLEEDIAV